MIISSKRIMMGGLGDVTSTAIHAVVRLMPIPRRAKRTILSCKGCRRRAMVLNKLVPKI